ncbi:MAG: class II aldolase/adducin family protein, partial [Rhodocyclaceae bacterium]|nr:class II aldolase/adducin family protein [Rhodocyclaceae bacterium]
MEGRRGCLMAHHGMLVAGGDLGEALALAIELEGLAEQYWRVLQIGGPCLLPEAEMVRVLEKFRDYGKQ